MPARSAEVAPEHAGLAIDRPRLPASLGEVIRRVLARAFPASGSINWQIVRTISRNFSRELPMRRNLPRDIFQTRTVALAINLALLSLSRRSDAYSGPDARFATALRLRIPGRKGHPASNSTLHLREHRGDHRLRFHGLGSRCMMGLVPDSGGEGVVDGHVNASWSPWPLPSIRIVRHEHASRRAIERNERGSPAVRTFTSTYFCA